MACLRQSSRAETPASASRRILLICSSEKRIFMGMSSCGLLRRYWHRGELINVGQVETIHHSIMLHCNLHGRQSSFSDGCTAESDNTTWSVGNKISWCMSYDDLQGKGPQIKLHVISLIEVIWFIGLFLQNFSDTNKPSLNPCVSQISFVDFKSNTYTS